MYETIKYTWEIINNSILKKDSIYAIPSAMPKDFCKLSLSTESTKKVIIDIILEISMPTIEKNLIFLKIL